ncbi:hypothetical protein DPMN_101194 [Dreissena polymorpha]|uniref:Uncharacterized protein n=1 Tax=Dreissena polymorpha TaxID=45954 RepID=A0A9D4LKM7_DREPO|nr:hypothetical protein DPMN_101194 [Dreissena polymorpha]
MQNIEGISIKGLASQSDAFPERNEAIAEMQVQVDQALKQIEKTSLLEKVKVMMYQNGLQNSCGLLCYMRFLLQHKIVWGE